MAFDLVGRAGNAKIKPIWKITALKREWLHYILNLFTFKSSHSLISSCLEQRVEIWMILPGCKILSLGFARKLIQEYFSL